MKASDQDPATLRACGQTLAREAKDWRAIAHRIATQPDDARRYNAIAICLETYAGEFIIRAGRNERARTKRGGK